MNDFVVKHEFADSEKSGTAAFLPMAAIALAFRTGEHVFSGFGRNGIKSEY